MAPTLRAACGFAFAIPANAVAFRFACAEVARNDEFLLGFPKSRIPNPVQIYLDLLRDVLEHGARKGDRTGTGTLSVFGRQIRMDLGAGFPLLTTKKLHIRSIVHELLWFLQPTRHSCSWRWA
jgi:hypothetical protein